MRLPALFPLIAAALLAADPHTTWRDYGGGNDSSQYSALKQIHRGNVEKLKPAWKYATGDGNKYFFNPIVIGRTMYVLAKNNSIVALDAATGRELWAHAAEPGTKVITNRGINYWQSKDGSESRLLYASNHALRAIDAKTGRSIASFGEGGKVDLKQDLGRDPASFALVQSTTPGRVFEDLLILGSATNQGYGSAPGDIRAYDVRSGKLVWSFHTIPHPGEFGYETWPKDAWKNVGGANVWGEFSLDEQRGILFAPTASAKYNFYGADRAGMNLFSDCLLALDARTGKRIWHYQMVHHDIWDYDDATAPKLLTVEHGGKRVDVVAQVSKQGFLWVFRRETGEPLWPVEERAAPKSDMPGETTWPTQPFPTKPPPFSRQSFTVDDLNPYLSAADRARFKDEILSARNEGLFTPPGRRPTIQMPGNNGGANWAGAAVVPDKGLLYVVSKDLPCLLRLEPESTAKTNAADSPEQRGLAVFAASCQACHGADRRARENVPAIADVALRLTRDQIIGVTRNGRGPMPGFPRLSDSQVDDLIAYLYNPARAVNAPAGSGETPERYVSGFGFMIASNGLSAIKPPWSSLTAYDLNEGTILWQIPLGEVPELAAKGITDTGTHYPKVGPVVTAGGLIFTGTRDKKVRALDSSNGKVLWEAEVDAALEGMAAVYEVDGREYVVFCASAQVGLTSSTQEPIRGAYVAFALGE
ncbi:MAG: pyrroloquinoline quinone-dependent dehydrogenase [Bryobacteraceae bacterium]